MRLTRVLCKQHIDRMFKKHWKYQGRRVPIETGAEAELQQRDIALTDPVDFFRGERPYFPGIKVIGIVPKPILWDNTHPMYHERPCNMYDENSVLVEGLSQAQVFTNSMQIKQGLPQALEELAEACASDLPENVDDLVQRCILGSHIFDALQEKLPIVKDPLRPAFTFPRVYGVADHRRTRLMTERLLALCGALGQPSVGLVVRGAPVRSFLEREDSLVKLEVQPGALLGRPYPLPPYSSNVSGDLPDIFPLKSTISMQTSNFYEDKLLYPLSGSTRCSHAHTAIFHFNETQVKQLHEEPITEQQILGRTLAHTFTVALAAARHTFGAKLDENCVLPEPITLQSIQTDGRWFHFSVLQLNTLGSENPRNVFWSTPRLSLFSSCQYNQGVPVLEGYNPQVFKNLLAFYNNGARK